MKLLRRSTSISLLLIITFIGLIFFTGCSNLKNEANIPSEDKKIVEDFFSSYLGQFKYSEEEWEDLIEHLDLKISSYDPEKTQWEETLDDDPWVVQWKETLTEKEVERLIKNTWLPNLDLKEYSGTDYSIEEIKGSDNSDSYSVSIKLKNTGNKSIDEKVNINLNLVDTENGRRIDYIDFEEFNSLLTIKK